MLRFAKRPVRSGLLLSLLLASLLICGSSLLIVSGCGDSEKKVTEESKQTWVQTVIYFGRDIPGGGVVPDAQFDKFLQDVVTKEFPKGLTAYDAYGQMQKDDGSIEKQSTKIVLLVHEKTSANSEAVKKIIDSYRSSFGTPQVMRTTVPIDVEFFQSATAAAKPTRAQVEAFVNEARQ
jgi:hypothetical protein